MTQVVIKKAKDLIGKLNNILTKIWYKWQSLLMNTEFWLQIIIDLVSSMFESMLQVKYQPGSPVSLDDLCTLPTGGIEWGSCPVKYESYS